MTWSNSLDGGCTCWGQGLYEALGAGMGDECKLVWVAFNVSVPYLLRARRA